MPEPIVEAAMISYRIDGVDLVSDVNFAASAGEFVGVLGPNGAGKSTLLRLLAGDLSPTKGTVTVDGRPIADQTPGELSLLRSMLPDHVPADVPFTVRAVVEMGRFPHRRQAENSPQRDTQAVADAMRRTDVEMLASRIFSTLSSGERARAFLARVLAQEAPLVLLDEPTAALDIANREHILIESTKLASEGRAVVCVLHDINAAAFHADRLVLMEKGSIRAAGTPREVLDAQLLGEVYGQPMQVIDHPFRDCPLVLVDGHEPDNRA